MNRRGLFANRNASTIEIARKPIVIAQPCHEIGSPAPIAEALGREPFGAIVAHLCLPDGRPRLRGSGVFNFTPRAAERLAQQAFDLGIDAAKVGGGAALDRRP